MNEFINNILLPYVFHIVFVIIELALAGYIYDKRKELIDKEWKMQDTLRMWSEEKHAYTKALRESFEKKHELLENEFHQRKLDLVRRIKEVIKKKEDISKV